ncbi:MULTISPECIES: helix-turn-helix transcriptional regulator [unclassified Aureimonas]|uniref:helix-turn-helix transcriptional regulator n=1 Tax=unclassified Aureimonas TaxID=2615206 RepID=UPI0006FA2586|nr:MULTISPECIES: helix-turn-helix transcriptional regulator [unclassified Aureimonas]KQT65951.1 transcriptional regulator [Aureimonas sp. Leaf427]KQT73310.1 transcriptional regulator [Aureimonas sp. Leaf460]
MILTPEQCRAARGLLDWTQEHLAQEAGVSRSTVRDFEKQRHHLNRASEELMIEAFAKAGVRLISLDEDGLGVRLVPSACGL